MPYSITHCARALQALWLRLRVDVVVGDEGSRRRCRPARTASQVDVVVAHMEDSSRSPTGHRIVRLVSDADPVFLRREAEAIDCRSCLGRGVDPGTLEGQLAEGVWFLPALLIGEFVPQVEVAPPERLRLAAVPVQELRQQPAPALVVARTFDIVGQPAGKRGDEPVYRLLRLAVLSLLRLWYRRARQVAELYGSARGSVS